MAFQCNIGPAGKRMRLITGIVTAAVGVGIIFAWAIPFASPAGWIFAMACLISGAFCIFEGAIGWCAVRAMGFKTRH